MCCAVALMASPTTGFRSYACSTYQDIVVIAASDSVPGIAKWHTPSCQTATKPASAAQPPYLWHEMKQRPQRCLHSSKPSSPVQMPLAQNCRIPSAAFTQPLHQALCRCPLPKLHPQDLPLMQVLSQQNIDSQLTLIASDTGIFATHCMDSEHHNCLMEETGNLC